MNRTTLYGYNNIGQLTNVNYASDVDISYFHDTLGRMTSRTDAAGTWVWSYDGDSSRLLSESVSGGAITSTVTYTYHPDTFDLASVGIDSSNRTFYTWEKGRLTQVSSFQFPVSYSYLPNSDLLSEMTNSVFFTRCSYDALSRLVAISNNVGATSVSRFLYTLDSTGRRTKRTDADNSWIDWGYDSHDQLISAARTNSANGAADKAYNYQYQYDLVGNHLHEDRGQLDLDGTFNPLNQLTYRKFAGRLDVYGSVDNTGSVVVVGGVTSAPPFFGGTNWWGSGGVAAGSNAIPIVANVGTNSTQTNLVVYMPPTNPQVFLWDRNGNLTNDGQRILTWNEENRLTSIETTAAVVSNGMSKLRSEFLYDGMGRRIQKVDYSSWNGTAYATTNTTQFTWDGWNLLSETISNQQSAITNSYFWGLDLSQTLQGAGGIGGLLCVIQNGQQYFPCYDGNGNISDYLDASGTVVAHYVYDPFGRTVSASGSKAADFTFRFSTKQLDHWCGMYYYGLRFYEPTLGRWTGRDPAEEDDRPNPYQFVRNEPSEEIDAFGDTTVCSSGARYRVDIASLDTHQADQGYAMTAAKRRQYNQQFVKFPIPAFAASGPRLVANEQEIKLPKKVLIPKKAIGVTHYLFFVDFEVCPTEKLGLKVTESAGTMTSCTYGFSKTPTCVTAPLKIPDSPIWPLGPKPGNYGEMLSKRKQPVGGTTCTHTVIFADGPQIDQNLLAFGTKKKVFRSIAFHQKVELLDNGKPVPGGTFEHDVSIGLDKSGTLIGTP